MRITQQQKAAMASVVLLASACVATANVGSDVGPAGHGGGGAVGGEASSSSSSSGSASSGSSGMPEGGTTSSSSGAGLALTVQAATNTWDPLVACDGFVNISSGTDQGFDCWDSCTVTNPDAGSLVLFAVPTPGCTFHSWTSDPPGDCASKASMYSCAVEVDANKTIAAHFVGKGGNLWASQYGGSGADEALAVTDTGSGYLVVGLFGGGASPESVGFGGAPLQGTGKTAHFVAKLSREGEHKASFGFGSTGDDLGGAVAAAVTAGAVFVGGMHTGAMTVGPSSLAAPAGGQDAFVVRLDADLVPKWAVGIQGPGAEVLAALGASDTGNAYAYVAYDADLTAPIAISHAGGGDVAVLKLDATGQVIWESHLADAAAQAVAVTTSATTGAMVVDAQGVVVTGILTSASASGVSWSKPGTCAPLVNPTPNAPVGFVSRLDNDGACVWSRLVGEPGQVAVSNLAVALGPSSEVYLAGSFLGALELEASSPAAKVTSAATGKDAFVARLDATGQWVPGTSFLRRIGDANSSAPTQYEQVAIALSADWSGVYVTLDVAGDVDSGCGTTAAAGGHDVLMARLSSDGSCSWARRHGSAGTDAARAMACREMAGEDGCVVVGRHGDPASTAQLDFGGIAPSPLPVPKGSDAFVAKFAR